MKETVYVRKKIKGVLEDTLKDYEAKNREIHILKAHFKINVAYIIIPFSQLSEAMQKNRYGWGGVYLTYPNAQGVTILSRVGLNSAKNQALVYVNNTIDSDHYEMTYFLLSREGNGWLIQTKQKTWNY
jgi:hypothetical protein